MASNGLGTEPIGCHPSHLICTFQGQAPLRRNEKGPLPSGGTRPGDGSRSIRSLIHQKSDLSMRPLKRTSRQTKRRNLMKFHKITFKFTCKISAASITLLGAVSGLLDTAPSSVIEAAEILQVNLKVIL